MKTSTHRPAQPEATSAAPPQGERTPRSPRRLAQVEGIHGAISHSGQGPLQAKAAVDTGYDGIVTLARAHEPRRPDATGMPAPVREKMEAAFGDDFSGVRVHAGSSRATALGALAYTQGSDIHVAPGHWAPETRAGQALLGHELAHVVQQRAGRVRATAQHNGVALNDDPSLEAEADTLGARAARGDQVPASGTRAAQSSLAFRPLQRSPLIAQRSPLGAAGSGIEVARGATNEDGNDTRAGRRLMVAAPFESAEIEADERARAAVGRSAWDRPTGGSSGRRFDAGPEVEAAIAAQRGRGSALPASVRDEMGTKLREDFTGVRVHTGGEADRLSRALNARAFTTDKDIFFRAGEFEPGTSRGRALVAHELGHVAQQGRASSGAGLILRTVWQWSKDDSRWNEISGVSKPITVPEDDPPATPPDDWNQDGVVYDGPTKQYFKTLLDYFKTVKLRTGKGSSTDDYYSDYSSSSDDERDLTPRDQMWMMMLKGQRKKDKLLEGNEGADGRDLKLHTPRMRGVYASHRTNTKDKASIASSENLMMIGHQRKRMRPGRGHFVQAGGNKDRPDGVKEPAADYAKLFDQMSQQGDDPNAAPLYKEATNGELGATGGKLSDAQMAAMALYYMNNDASKINEKLGKRTQLTEHLSTFTAVVGIAEQARGLEASPAPYDTTLLIKRGLHRVKEGEGTLQEMFYKGAGGAQSIFIGAPNKTNSPRKIGGAEQIRNPFDPKNEEAFKRQMSIFPAKKGDFKEALNALRSTAKNTAPALTEADKQALEAPMALDAAKELADEVRELHVPDVAELNDEKGKIQVYTCAIEAMEQNTKDETVLKLLDEADENLKKKTQEALAKLPPGDAITTTETNAEPPTKRLKLDQPG